MDALRAFEGSLTPSERETLSRLTTPFRIQAFLDSIPYSTDPIYRSPRRVLRDRKAHCFDGGVFAAAALRRIGHPPRIVDMKAERDDDHLLAIYKVKGHFGAVAKSNFVGLRFREPIYRTLRELVLSYFEQFYNLEREKTFRRYTVPLNLESFDGLGWMWDDAPLERIAERLEVVRIIPALTPGMIEDLSPVDERSYRAGMLGTDPAGLYRPPIREEDEPQEALP